MNEKLEKYLYKTYPLIFPKQISATFWGIECDDGWFMLIDRLCYKIQIHIDHCNYKKKEVEQLVASQVKQKLSELRFYYYGGDADTDTFIGYTTYLSHYVCERCGKFDTSVGLQYINGWYKTVCKECSDVKGRNTKQCYFNFNHIPQIRLIEKNEKL